MPRPAPALLSAAAADLAEVEVEALEEGFPRPTRLALETAERLLRDLYSLSPRRYEVYPMPDGEIALPGGARGRSVVLYCEPQGGVLCLVNIEGAHRRAAFDDAALLPDAFVREALEELDRTTPSEQLTRRG